MYSNERVSRFETEEEKEEVKTTLRLDGDINAGIDNLLKIVNKDRYNDGRKTVSKNSLLNALLKRGLDIWFICDEL